MFDSVFIAIGAQEASRLGCPGEDARGVLYAVDLLAAAGEGNAPDLTGKRVVVVGGGNVAMDAARTARRLGAGSVTIVYRRRIKDMTALPEEVEGAMAEGCEVMQLMAPVRIEVKDDKVAGFVMQPQIPGPISDGRPAPVNAEAPEVLLPCDIVIVAIGQAVDSEHFRLSGVKTRRNRIVTDLAAKVAGLPGVFAGGDCYSGPATVIRAIDAGKVAACNIEAYFGFKVPIASGVEVPPARDQGRPAWGRVNMRERSAESRKDDFKLMEICLTDEEAVQECSRCLRCDHYGYGAFRGGRNKNW